MIKRVRDEGLITQNFKNVRIAFLIQTAGIVGVLAYYAISEGVTAVVTNPIWVVLVVSLLVFFILHLRISNEMRETAKGSR